MLRRDFLTASTAGALTAVAGCAGTDGDTPTETPPDAMGAATTASPTATPTPADGPLLTVRDQQTDGQSVTIRDVRIDQDGWLVIHPEKEGGGPKGSVTLATRRLSAGSHLENTTVDLSRTLSTDQTVYPMLHYEDPADGEFTFPERGDPPVSTNGKPLVKPMALTVEGAGAQPVLRVQDQTTDGQSIRIQEVRIDEDGWLVVHPEKAGGGPKGSVTLARKQLSAGTHLQKETIQLSTTLTTDQTVYPMLHYEDPADGNFTFPESGDPPVTTDGNPLLKPMALTVSGGTTTVSATGSTFDPVRVTVDPGTTVEWTNEDGYAHDVTAAQFHDTAADWSVQKDLPAGGTVTHEFDSEGVYEYYCTIHGESQMCGAVLVGDVSLTETLPCESDGNGGGY